MRNLIKKSEVKKNIKKTQRTQQIKLPEKFSLASDRNGALAFIHSLSTIKKINGKFLFFDFTEVKDISHGAITILLSYIGWLNDQGYTASGNYPKDQSSKDNFIRSGFLNFFKLIGTKKYQKGESTIVAREGSKTNSELTAKLIRNCMKTVWGVEDRNTKVQGMLIELMANTINHAYINQQNQKGWYFSVDHDLSTNSVKFCFVDNGSGILKTLNKKFGQRIAAFVGLEKDGLIRKAFEGQFGSRTQQSNRGRGLKAIKKVFEQGHIKSLRVITNNIFYDFDTDTIEVLDTSFNGTFYFWEINNQCKK